MHFEESKVLTSPLCILLGDFGDSTVQKITTGSIAAFLLISVITALAFYVSLIRFVSTFTMIFNKITGESLKRRGSSLTFNLALVCLTNIACWLPTSIFYLLSPFVKKYPLIFQYLITLIVLPINPLLNPVLFNLSDLKLFVRKMNSSFRFTTVSLASRSNENRLKKN